MDKSKTKIMFYGFFYKQFIRFITLLSFLYSHIYYKYTYLNMFFIVSKI
jgi:hypothetical protein